jgi:hypothetical protein
MRSKTTRVGVMLIACFTLFLSAPSFTPIAQAQTYFIQSQDGVPLPYDPYDGAEPIVTIDAAKQIYRVQDNTNDWEMLMTARELDSMSTSSTMSADSIDPGGTNDSGGGTYTNYFQPAIVFGPDDLWIEITNVDIINQQASLILHGTLPDDHYQLLSSNVLSGDGEAWTLGEVITGAADTNQTAFSTFNINTNSQMFFRGHHANPEVAITPGPNAIEPNPASGDPGQVGYFTLSSYYELSNDLPVYFKIGGTAQNGIDYSNLTGTVTLTHDNQTTNIFIVPIADNLTEGDESVTLTIQQTNDYLIDPNNGSATIPIEDSSTLVSVYENVPNAIEPNGPTGIPAQVGTFQFNRSDERNLYPEMTVYYVTSGTASNGVDYVLLTNSLVFPDGVSTVYLDVTPLADSILEGTETATVTLVPTNTYVVDTNNFTQTVNIIDSSTTVSIFFNQDAIETNSAAGVGQVGIFNVSRSDTRGDYPSLTVNYLITGTASNGVDYQTLSGTVTFADGASDTNIFIQTLPDNLIEGDETVTLTVATNGSAYYISQDNSNATLTIHDTVYFLTVTNLSSPIGVDFDTLSNSLIVSYNYDGGSPSFARIYTNITVSGGVPVTNTIFTNWSGIGGLPDEVYLTIPKMPLGALTNSAGFTNGDMFFGSDTGIGWLSADTTRSNLNWCILTNSVETNVLTLRGGICTDQTGTFSNNIIAVTSQDDTPSDKGVWMVDSKGRPTLLTNIFTPHLEGVTTLTNDVAKWGPWAGKIITGDEAHFNTNTFAADPVIYTISTNGTVSSYPTTALVANGIFPEDFDVIPANQNLYITAFNVNAIMELPSDYFTNHVGDLLITDAGEVSAAGLYIVHWNGSNFVTTSIPVPDSVGGHIEGVTFAPLKLPGH